MEDHGEVKEPCEILESIVMVFTCNPNTWKPEAGITNDLESCYDLERGQLGLPNEFQARLSYKEQTNKKDKAHKNRKYRPVVMLECFLRLQLCLCDLLILDELPPPSELQVLLMLNLPFGLPVPRASVGFR